VVGLNFDFLAINLTGYLCYAAFNLGLYYIPSMKVIIINFSVMSMKNETTIKMK